MDETKPTDHAAHAPGDTPSPAMAAPHTTEDPDKTKILITYILYLPSILIAVILPFIFKGDASPFAKTHYDNQISIAWRGFVMNIAVFVLGILLAFTDLGFVGTLLSLAVWAWIIIRSVKGLMALNKGEPAVDTGFGI